MATPEAPLSTESLLTKASINFVEALNLPKAARVILITDRQNDDPDCIIRRKIADHIEQLISQSGGMVERLEFDNSTPKRSGARESVIQVHDGQVRNITTGQSVFDGSWLDETRNMAKVGFYDEVREAFSRLIRKCPGTQEMTLVYIGDGWDGRAGIYQAFASLGSYTGIKTRAAVSPSINEADIEILGLLDSGRRKVVQERVMQLLKLFHDYPKGTLQVESRFGDQKYTLSLQYDVDPERAPFEGDLGSLVNDHPAPQSFGTYGRIDNLGNIPGGEVCGTAYPWKNSRGQFVSKEGLLFSIQDGMVVSVSSLGAELVQILPLLISSQRKLVELLAAGTPIPFAELGIGMLKQAGIIIEESQKQSKKKRTLLTEEKDEGHIGLGSPMITSEEADFLKLIGPIGFHHTDFVAEETEIYYISEDGAIKMQIWPSLERIERDS